MNGFEGFFGGGCIKHPGNIYIYIRSYPASDDHDDNDDMMRSEKSEPTAGTLPRQVSRDCLHACLHTNSSKSKFTQIY